MKVTKRMLLNAFWIVLGMVLVILCMKGRIDAMYSGFGGGLVGVGIVNLIRCLRYQSNSEYREKVDTEITDERNKYLRMKAWSWAGYLFVMVTAAAAVVCMVAGQSDYCRILGMMVCLMVLLYAASYMVLSRKY